MVKKLLFPLLSILLMPLLAVEPVMAQSPAAADPASEALQINIVDADIANPPLDSHVQGLTVQVTDASGAYVRDAAVVFRLPDSGSSARFADGTLAAVTYTDANGKARVNDIRWSETPGSVMVRVTAVKGTAHAGLLFERTPSSAAKAVSAGAAQQSVTVQPVVPAPSPIETAQPHNIPVSVVSPRAPANRPTVPGNVPAVSITNKQETDDDSQDANVPVRHSSGAENVLAEAPDVSITSSGAASGGHSKKKWIAVLAIAAGTGAALALVHKGGTSSSSSASGVSIGSPSISVGHP